MFMSAWVYMSGTFDQLTSPPPATAHPRLRWGNFKDEGCIQRGQRRMYARLFGLSMNEDWKAACTTMPARVNGKWYNRPTYCDDKAVLGIYGVFQVNDGSCN
ncbi:hypothetical protein BDV93DRAFT_548662 [Ceratobasidium sp. AG-I]|nr:hypothetical protein BDV93DRAFT_548662 [Ceratobasidium sp. AG-I]